MPSIKDKSTVEAIAREFCSNGRNKVEALKTMGYQPSYYNTLGLSVVYGNIRVKKAIARIDAKNQVKNERTVQSIDSMQQAAYDLAMRIKQPSAAVSAGTAIARLYGMDKDAGAGTKDEPKPITASDLTLLRGMARAITDNELAQPVLDVASVAVESLTEEQVIDRSKDDKQA